MADLLVDTDIFVDHLRGAAAIRPRRHRLHYSVITRAELFAGNTASNLTVQLLAPFRELAVDRDIAERAGRIVRQSGVRLPDALIAATALERRLALSPATATTSTRSEAFACGPSETPFLRVVEPDTTMRYLPPAQPPAASCGPIRS